MLLILEVGKSEVIVPAWSRSGEHSLPHLQIATFLWYPHMAEREREREREREGGREVCPFFIKALTPSPVVLEKTLESPLDCKEIQPVHSKGDQSFVFGRNDAKRC